MATGPSNNVFQLGAIFASMTLGAVPMLRTLVDGLPCVRRMGDAMNPEYIDRAQAVLRKRFRLDRDVGYKGPPHGDLLGGPVLLDGWLVGPTHRKGAVNLRVPSCNRALPRPCPELTPPPSSLVQPACRPRQPPLGAVEGRFGLPAAHHAGCTGLHRSRCPHSHCFPRRATLRARSPNQHSRALGFDSQVWSNITGLGK